MGDREALKSIIAKGIVLREKLIKHPTIEMCNDLLNIAIETKTIGLQLKHQHGILLGEELSIRATYEKMVLEEDSDKADSVYERIVRAIKQAEYLGDQDLILRLYQTRADYYSLIGDIIMEIDTVERANLILKDHNRSLRLIKLYGEFITMLNSIVPKKDEEKMIADKTMEANYKCMCELQMLRNEKGFDYEGYIKKNHSLAFRVYVYCGVMLSNPFVYEIDSKEQKVAREAFELAIEVAGLIGNTEYLCAAWGQKVGSYYGRGTAQEKQEWLDKLLFLKDKYKPKEHWIDETLADIENSAHIKLRNSDLGVEEPLNDQ
ncbi:hypothetical protein EHI8A_048490 [Entamoeba histolytica HM-1:IMSS-B]|uniref:Uncharacterized protein n=6 Tax=Entamoeba histolytica TaxID=5759 RepID=C4M225_ENTH1|nr:hypothetical protein EHI_150440 [Entamoeba histolytica HM-1:IMSS]EMD46119.1 Hypothetical protein EHI5A_079410 [Entamoeba histolytica KU27]EMH73893.1 hypothetical protein EHI8A_048490 [Entamoeba histolytica HM-1:IMSS-B]EMS15386.1 hypothetical protein KM1_095990 [Entamoeba histolytica HM-3:IMSS]ENY62863.1 hypothetical protein EHI7A_048980 [Entamoeba histolytica HM-1:IMSS-A]GAT95305.1 hypothetical protein CL6EHI_150440 [Entamoeba histolytica]|eukprot:XP_655821.1 hypothetical protein EHI_150440 [Entamoeba histolytica HM-1:IMSS]